MNPAPGLVALLWARRGWLITGIVVAILVAASRFVSIGILPPSVKLKQLAHATASTQLLVGPHDSLRSSTYRDPYVRLAVSRAQALANVMASPQVRGLIARAAGVPASQLAVDTPVWTNVERVQQWPSGEKRDSEIILENVPFRITVDVEGYGPVIDIATQAPTPQQAVALAAGAGEGLNAYVAELESTTGTPPTHRYTISQLVPIGVSPALKSGLANVAAFTFAVVLFLWCGALLFLSGLAEDIRAVRRTAKVSRNTDRSSHDRPVFPDPTAVPKAAR